MISNLDMAQDYERMVSVHSRCVEADDALPARSMCYLGEPHLCICFVLATFAIACPIIIGSPSFSSVALCARR